MKQCKICLDSDSCSFDWRDPDCEYMNCTEFKKPPPTNADRIRAMSDEELADFICKTQFAFIPKSLGNIPISVYDGMSVLEWLKQEAEE